jgi:hypothetical protein
MAHPFVSASRSAPCGVDDRLRHVDRENDRIAIVYSNPSLVGVEEDQKRLAWLRLANKSHLHVSRLTRKQARLPQCGFADPAFARRTHDDQACPGTLARSTWIVRVSGIRLAVDVDS